MAEPATGIVQIIADLRKKHHPKVSCHSGFQSTGLLPSPCELGPGACRGRWVGFGKLRGLDLYRRSNDASEQSM